MEQERDHMVRTDFDMDYVGLVQDEKLDLLDQQSSMD